MDCIIKIEDDDDPPGSGVINKNEQVIELTSDEEEPLKTSKQEDDDCLIIETSNKNDDMQQKIKTEILQSIDSSIEKILNNASGPSNLSSNQITSTSNVKKRRSTKIQTMNEQIVNLLKVFIKETNEQKTQEMGLQLKQLLIDIENEENSRNKRKRKIDGNKTKPKKSRKKKEKCELKNSNCEKIDPTVIQALLPEITLEKVGKNLAHDKEKSVGSTGQNLNDFKSSPNSSINLEKNKNKRKVKELKNKQKATISKAKNSNTNCKTTISKSKKSANCEKCTNVSHKEIVDSLMFECKKIISSALLQDRITLMKQLKELNVKI